MRKHRRKGFTIVELVIVIGVIGILAAILIPTFIAITGKAQQASNESFVHNINTQLGIHESEPGGGKCSTMEDAVKEADKIGFDVTKITPYNGNDIVWNQQTNRFLIVKSDFAEHKDLDHVVYSEGTFDISTPTYYLWKIYDAMPSTQNYSIYPNPNKWDVNVASNKNIAGLKVGFDVGSVAGIESIAFVGDGSTQTDARIRTGGTALTINAPNATVSHYDFATSVDVDAVSASTYHEFGTVGRTKYAAPAGKIRFESGSVTYCYMNKSEDANADVSASTKLGSAIVHSHITSAGASTIYEGKEVTVANKEVDVASCHNHNANFDVVEINGDKFVLCKCCGGYSRYVPNPTTGEYEEAQLPAGVPQPEDFDYNPNPTNQTYHFYDSYVKDGHWVHEIETKAHFRNIMDHIDSYKASEAEGYPLADKTTVYLIRNDIDFEGSLWTSTDDSVWKNHFTGTLKSNDGVTIGNMAPTVFSTQNLTYNGRKCIPALFDGVNNAQFENITLSGVIVNNSEVEYSGLFAGGNSKETITGYVRFTNCHVDSSSSISIRNGAAGFLACGRYYSEVSFANCSNAAKVVASNGNAAGFIGNNASGSGTVQFTGCTNSGRIEAGTNVGGFLGYPGSHDVTLTDCLNEGDIYDITGKNNSGLFIGGGPAWPASITCSNVVNSGSLYFDTEDLAPTGLEYTKYGSSDPYVSIKASVDGPAISKEQYMSLFAKKGVDALALSWNGFTLASSAHANVASVTVTLDLHALRINRLTGLESPGFMQSEGHVLWSKDFSSLEAIDIKRVGQCGYFIPDGCQPPFSTIDYKFDLYKLNGNTLGNEFDLTQGYHERADGKSYFVVTNEETSDLYYAVCEWRNRVEYTVVAKDSGGNTIATGSIQYGWNDETSGYTSLLTAITAE